MSPDLIKPQFELLVSGCGLLEGPRVDSENRLYYSDTQKGGVHRRSPDGRIETLVPKRRGVGGIALHEDGGVVVTGRNVCHVTAGESRIVFGPQDIPGFNDLFIDAQGRILVGSLRSHAFSNDGPRDTGELYLIDVAGAGKNEDGGEAQRVSLLYEDIAMSNGLGISPDGTRLYHSDSTRKQILLHDLDDAGACTNRRVFAELKRGVPDGLAVDEEGCVWVAAYGGGRVLRFAPDGGLDRELEIPAKIVTSVCFGGPDRRDLYVVTADNSEDAALAGCIFKTRAHVAGLPVPLARV